MRESMRDESAKKFLRYVDSVEIYHVEEEKDLDFCVINPRLSTDLIPSEEIMDEASFDSYGMWYAFSDKKPWLCMHIERDGLVVGMSLSPEIIQDWINLIRRYPEHDHYLPDGDMSAIDNNPDSFITDAQYNKVKKPETIRGQQCPLEVNRQHAGNGLLCKSCPKCSKDTHLCRWDGWYNPFGDD
jgi:hypothetical protein